tara:strand:+ start:368 stop:1426 length:1059 start_codon:yes stop_codon:yes gene_type:complete
MKINNNFIGKDQPTFFIADIGANHDGDLERAKELIYLAAESGANAAKFQHFQAETIVSDYGFKSLGKQFSHQSKWRKSVFEVYKDASLDLSWTPTLKKTCDDAGISFFTSPYAFDLVDHVDQYVPAYKIGSGDITWLEIIKYIAERQKPFILATGASTLNEVRVAVNAALEINKNFCLMQCNTNYTGSKENFKNTNLNVLKSFSLEFPDITLGLSDHTSGHSTCLGAIALGAKMIEKHFTDDTSREGPDHAFAMNPKTWKEMVYRSRELEESLGDGIKKLEKNELDTVILQRRSIRLKKNLLSGEIIDRNAIEILRPCPRDAISPSEINLLLGKKLNIDKKMGDYIKWKDVV